jgi:glucokinase
MTDPAHITAPTAAPQAVLALEFGGTRLRGGLVTREGELLAGATTATEAHRGAAHVLAQADALLASLQPALAGARLAGLGISAAGIIDRPGARVLAAHDTMPGWAGTGLRSHFQARLGAGFPVWADNDANCALAGELWRGGHAADEEALTVMLTLGTGLGGAIAHGGRVLAGASQRAGHFGSVRTWHARQQAVVPLESVVSGTGLMNLYHLAAPPGALRAAGGEEVARWAADAASPAHPHAQAALREWGELLADFLQDLHVSLDPALVILGGGVLRSQAQWWGPLSQRLEARGVSLRLAPAALGNDAGLLGAASLAWQHLPA